jgi:hypothetical protein
MKNLINFCMFLVFVIIACYSGSADYYKLKPKDESTLDSSFISFKNELLIAIKNKDSLFIYSILSDKILVGFDMDGMGVNAFKREWKPYKQDSELWNELNESIIRGCIKNKYEGYSCFICPYMHALFPDSLDPFTHVILIDSCVPLYQEPLINSSIICNLDFAILKVTSWKPKNWVKVNVLPTGTEGYVQREKCYSAGGNRAIFTKKGKHWKLEVFVGGD